MKNFQIYNASAGSGKTNKLVEEYLSLIIKNPNKNATNEILTISFTNKAAIEIKQRILDQLRYMANLKNEKKKATASKDIIINNLLKRLKIDDEIIKKNSKIILKNILHDYNSFKVKTIDSFIVKSSRFFYRELRHQHDFEIELNKDDVIKEATNYFLEYIYMRKNETQEILFSFSYERYINNKNYNITNLFKKYAEILFKDESYPYLKKLSNYSTEEIHLYFEKIKTNILNFKKDLIIESSHLLNKMNELNIQEEDLILKSKGFKMILTKMSQNPDLNIKIPQKIREGIKNKNVFKNNKHQLNLDANWYTKANYLVEKIESEVPKIKSLEEKLKFRYATTFLNLMYKSFIDYNRFSMKLPLNFLYFQLADLIQKNNIEFIYDRIGNRIKHCLIDEFQDTSLIQWECLRPILENSLASGGNVILLGDNKQAIYRWRNGDPRLFTSLPQGLPEKPNSKLWVSLFQQKNLIYNFRSKGTIVNFNNTFFEYLKNKYENILKNTYNNVKQKIGTTTNDQTDSDGSVQIHLIDENIYIPNVCHEIIKKLDERLYKLSDTCILVRTNKIGTEISRYLWSQNISVYSPDALNLSLSKQVQSAFFLWAHINFKADKLYKVSLLTAIRDIDHINYLGEDPLKILEENFGVLNLAHILKQPPSIQMINIFKYLNFFVNKNAFTNKFIDEWLQHCSTGKSKYEIVKWWVNNIHKITVESGNTNEAVQIMTIHKSKGLQFKNVIVAEIDYNKSKESNSTVWLEEKNEVPPILISTNKDSRIIEAINSKMVIENEMKMIDYFNLLYVALTRAEDNLYVITGNPHENSISFNNLFPEYMTKFCAEYTHEIKTHFQYKVFGWGNEKGPFSIRETKIITQNKPAEMRLQKSLFKSNAHQRTFFQNIETEEQVIGKIFHSTIHYMGKFNDWEKYLTDVAERHNLTNQLRLTIANWIVNLTSHQDLKKYFCDDSFILKEHHIIGLDGSISRPDFLYIKDGKMEIIEFKTGKAETNHAIQISNYIKNVRSTGISCTGKIVYLGDNISIQNFEK